MVMAHFDILYQKSVEEANEIFENTFHPIKGIDSLLTHSGHEPLSLPDMGYPVIAPMSLSTTFQQLTPGIAKYDYSRSGNFGRHALEKCLSDVENGDGAFAFASGLAALGACLQLLKVGDHVVAFDDLYGGNGRLFRQIAIKAGLEFSFVDMRHLELVKAAFRPATRMIFIETPSNPLMRLVDIAGIAQIAHETDDRIIVVVDNTFMTPYFQRPLDFGADLSLSSLTKYMNGHSDVVMGAVVVGQGRSDLQSQLKFIQYAAGAVPSAFDCYLCLRGLRTLAVRMRTHMRSGLVIASFLSKHPMVEAVVHPGLASHPQRDLARRQTHGQSGMVCVYLRANAEQTVEFVKKLKFFYLAESLGGFESLIEIPSIMTHASVTAENRRHLGITDNMLRISVGLEDTQDLAKDLFDALEQLKTT